MLKILPALSVLFCVSAFADCDMSLGDHDTWAQARPKWECMVGTLKQRDELLQQQKEALTQKDQQLKDARTQNSQLQQALSNNATAADWDWTQARFTSVSNCVSAAVRTLTINHFTGSLNSDTDHAAGHGGDGTLAVIFCVASASKALIMVAAGGEGAASKVSTEGKLLSTMEVEMK